MLASSLIVSGTLLELQCGGIMHERLTEVSYHFFCVTLSELSFELAHTLRVVLVILY